VIHAAGAAGRSAALPLVATRRVDVHAHLAPKLHGAEALERALDGGELDFCLLFSSLSTVLGGLGFTAYAAANAAMDAVALRHNRTRPGRWISVDWDGWRTAEPGAEAGGAAAASDPGMALAMTTAEGIAALDRVLAQPVAGRVAVSTADLDARRARWVDRRERRAGGEAGGAERTGLHRRPELQNPYVEPDGDVEREVAEVWSRHLGLERVGVLDNFFELGGSSLIGIEVIAEINRRFGTAIGTVGLYESPTVRALAAQVAGGGPAAPAQRERLARSRGRGDRRRRRFEAGVPVHRDAAEGSG
jgi:hypothetical protein